MPNAYIERISKDHNISVEQLEKYWVKAKYIVDTDTDGYWPKVVSVFKSILKSKHNIDENVSFKDFNNLTNENYDEQEEMPSKHMQQLNIKDKYESSN